MAFDFTPLFRSTIGFDGMTTLLSHALEREGNGFPPYMFPFCSHRAIRVPATRKGPGPWTNSAARTPRCSMSLSVKVLGRPTSAA